MRNWGLWLAAGIISLLGGIFALANPLAATLTATLLAAWAFIVVGILTIASAFADQGWGGRIAAIRGVESNGMMCSTRELELGEDHDGIIELPEDAPVGTAFADYAGYMAARLSDRVK